MAYDQLEAVILRSMNDEAFLDRLIAAPEQALESFDLTEEEFVVVAEGDEYRLNELLGLGDRNAIIKSGQYNHSQHKGGLEGQKPDLLPRIVSE